MGRPKGSKNKKEQANEVPNISIDEIEKIDPKEIQLYCKECGGILFSSRIIHRGGCSRA